MTKRLPAKYARCCPSCGAALTWVEAQRVRALSFHYYEPCAGCTALVCFD